MKSTEKTIPISLSEYQNLQSTIAQLQSELSWLKRQLFGKI
ncbi:hypothetical protein QA601_13890 [Chitinispirillales bacterium ANBcel5]|nr:hypothetical protein [Chitinispirillales bacterium ANBcel5]